MKESNRGWWSVSLVVSNADAGPMSGAMDWTLSEDVREVRIADLLSDEEGVAASFTVELRSSSAQGAEQRAQALAAQVRRAAGLSDAVLAVAWVAPLSDDAASSQRFLAQASDLLTAEQPELAVVAAQIHFEVQLGVLLRRAVRPDAPRWAQRLIKLRGVTSLGNDMSKVAVQLLLGLDPVQTQEWTEFEAHVKRRNAIAHTGQAVSEKDAAASISVVRKMWVRLSDAARARELEEPPS